MRALLSLATFASEESGLRLVDDEGKTEARVVIDQAHLAGAEEPFPPLVEVVAVRGYDARHGRGRRSPRGPGRAEALGP